MEGEEEMIGKKDIYFGIASIVVVWFGLSCSKENKASHGKIWNIGFSQVTVKEPWRVIFNERLQSKAESMTDKVHLTMLDADDKTENQVSHIQTFISKKMNAILISPKEASGCSKAIEEATKLGIPVIVLDRNTTFRGYAAFIGADNREIGRAAGHFTVEWLKARGKGTAVVYEICGSLASTPAQERRNGFHDIVEKEPWIKILGGLDGDWKLDQSKAIAQDAFQIHKNIDVVYAHNDPMAYGAYQAAREMGIETSMAFLGIDGLPGEGCLWVKQGVLAATFLYPTPGEKGLDLALDILEGRHVLQPGEVITLSTAVITRDNVDEFLTDTP